ncbi:MAG: type I phosphomannose isomerase catalytic subunit [Pirellulaceae bacterium]|nr:type I phosphomannose isomerase catalytic subunit [Pirellulaceae bacterium]
MPPLYPLTFRPVLKRYLWGGRRLGSVLGKPLGEGSDYAESWEVVDHGGDQTAVANGSLAGVTLGELVRTHGAELFGSSGQFERFPLLFKFLDAQRDLSVQVHPDDAAAAKLDPPDLGKTEAWLILDALPGAKVYAGLIPGLDRASLAREIAAGRTEQCLASIEPRPGDCLFIPAGTVHALGAGLLVAEIQQASDTTYRLFDWNRVGADGRPRPLHIEPGLAVIDYAATRVVPQTPQPTERPHVERLVACDKFVLDRWRIGRSGAGRQTLGGDGRFHIVSVLAGEARLADLELARGQTVLLPASVGAVNLNAAAGVELLDMYLPK